MFQTSGQLGDPWHSDSLHPCTAVNSVLLSNLHDHLQYWYSARWFIYAMPLFKTYLFLVWLPCFKWIINETKMLSFSSMAAPEFVVFDCYNSLIKVQLQVVEPVSSFQWRRHGDVIKWKHFPRFWPFVRGIQPWPVDSPHKGQLSYFFICLDKRFQEQTIEMPVIWDAIAPSMTSS